jgi:hypothetical protein
MSLQDLGLDTPFYQLTPLQQYVPILQQPKANMTTNIPHSNVFVTQRPSPVEQEKTQKHVADLSTRELLHKISVSFDDMVVDAYNKPENVTFIQHIYAVCRKDDRYFFLGILLLIVVVILVLFEK